MKQTLSIYILLTIILTATVIGCSRDEEIIDLMPIEIIEIYITQTERPTTYAVSLRVVGILSDSCHSYHETHYEEPDPITYSPRTLSPNYSNGASIDIEITQSIYTGPDYCLTAVYYYHDVIFLGYFEPGEYTLNLNGHQEKFQVG